MLQAESLRRKIRARLAEQRALVAQLLKLREQLRGSLFVRYGQCGKEGCACRRGRRHGPYYVLSTRSAGRGGFAYVEAGRVDEARASLALYLQNRPGTKISTFRRFSPVPCKPMNASGSWLVPPRWTNRI
jgi:hypothetical protein